MYIRRACGHGDMETDPHQVMAATLTLFQPWGTDYKVNNSKNQLIKAGGIYLLVNTT